MELLISVAITAALIAISIPTYVHYKRQFYYQAVVTAAEGYQSAVTKCIQNQNGNINACYGGQHGIPENITHGTGALATVIVQHGIITATPRAAYGITSHHTYILTPKIIQHRIVWTATGEGCKRDFAQNC